MRRWRLLLPRLPLDLKAGDRVRLHSTGAYTTTYSAINFNGFDPLKAIDLVTAWSYSSFAAKPSFPGPGMSLHGSNRALMRRTLSIQ